MIDTYQFRTHKFTVNHCKNSKSLKRVKLLFFETQGVASGFCIHCIETTCKVQRVYIKLTYGNEFICMLVGTEELFQQVS